MAKDEKPQDLMGYDALQQDAMRSVVRAALQRAASPRGLPGEHHFYISFRTGATGVQAPPDIVGRYPEEMTIVLQNQYWDLTAGDDAFKVTLQFGGQPKSLSIPYAAITRFYDPSVQYLLQFSPEEAPAPAARPPATLKPVAGSGPGKPRPREADKTIEANAEAPKIVSLDQFRKK